MQWQGDVQLQGITYSGETKLTAHHTSINIIPFIVTYGAPPPSKANLNTPLQQCPPTNQSQLAIHTDGVVHWTMQMC